MGHADPSPSPTGYTEGERTYAVERDARVKSYTAAFPMVDVAARNTELPDYVRLRLGNKFEVAKVDRDTCAYGREAIRVSTKAFPHITTLDGQSVLWDNATKGDWNRHRIVKDRALQLALIGFALAALGLVIDTALTLGDHVPNPILITQRTAVLLRITKAFLLLGGLIVVWKAKLEETGSR